MPYSCLNWDKESWLSSKLLYDELINDLTKHLDINSKSKILDIGCGRAHLIKNLSSKIPFDYHPVGVEPINHNLKSDNKIKIVNENTQQYFKKNKLKFDYIFFKQVLHLIPLIERKILYQSLRKTINKQGKIVVIQMDNQHEFPCFPLMREGLDNSLLEHKKIIKEFDLYFSNIKIKKFCFQVNISKIDYINMIKDKFISVLADLTKSQIEEGCLYIDERYSEKINFKDKLLIYLIN